MDEVQTVFILTWSSSIGKYSCIGQTVPELNFKLFDNKNREVSRSTNQLQFAVASDRRNVEWPTSVVIDMLLQNLLFNRLV